MSDECGMLFAVSGDGPGESRASPRGVPGESGDSPGTPLGLPPGFRRNPYVCVYE